MLELDVMVLGMPGRSVVFETWCCWRGEDGRLEAWWEVRGGAKTDDALTSRNSLTSFMTALPCALPPASECLSFEKSATAIILLYF
jgi:hypothetical protein